MLLSNDLHLQASRDMFMFGRETSKIPVLIIALDKDVGKVSWLRLLRVYML